MKNAYALLGLSFLIVFTGAYLVLDRAYAPTQNEVQTRSATEPTHEQSTNQTHTMSLTLTSPAFEHNGKIPSKYTCDGENVNPEFTISGVPEGAQSLALLMHDPDIPENVKAQIGQDSFDHWVLYAIDPKTERIPEGEGDAAGSPGVASNGNAGYAGPCPPDGEHRYIFRLYALSSTLNFVKEPTLSDVQTAIAGSILEESELIGRYEREN